MSTDTYLDQAGLNTTLDNAVHGFQQWHNTPPEERARPRFTRGLREPTPPSSIDPRTPPGPRNRFSRTLCGSGPTSRQYGTIPEGQTCAARLPCRSIHTKCGRTETGARSTEPSPQAWPPSPPKTPAVGSNTASSRQTLSRFENCCNSARPGVLVGRYRPTSRKRTANVSICPDSKDNYVPDSSHPPCPACLGFRPDLGLQPQLGLWSEWRLGIDPRHRANFGSDQSYLIPGPSVWTDGATDKTNGAPGVHSPEAPSSFLQAGGRSPYLSSLPFAPFIDSSTAASISP